ncbi:MAG: hypothetical protein ACRC1J_07845, partial [Sandaracinobacteroides sp.]
MAEAPVRTGSALRAYQVVLILLLGWAAGRIPQWLSDGQAEQARLLQALGPMEAPAAAGGIDTARLAADIAAQVAAQVANDTVGRLIAAGWAPRSDAPAPRIVVEMAPGRAAPETVVRVVNEQAPVLAGFRYDLPPGQVAAPDGPGAAAPDG